MRIISALMILAFCGVGFADTLVLRSGQTVNGTYLGGTARQIKMEVGDQIQMYDTGDVVSLNFSAPAPPPPPAPPAPAAPPQASRTQPSPPPAPAPPSPPSTPAAPAVSAAGI